METTHMKWQVLHVTGSSEVEQGEDAGPTEVHGMMAIE
jgi:hypothetical protein